MQRCRRRAGHPGGIGAGLRVADLLFHHVRHHIGCGPHALADLRLAGHAAGEPDGNIALFIGGDPVAFLDIAFGEHRAGLHRGVDFIAGAVEEAGVDEHHPVLHGVDTGGKIGGCAAFLVHHPDLDRVAVETEQIFDLIEQVVGERAFFRPVHFRFDDIDRPGAAVAQLAQPFDIVHRDQAGEHSVEQAFRRFRTIGQQHGGIGHQMADIADKHQAAARQGEGLAVEVDIVAIRVGLAFDGLAALFEGGIEITAHQAEPVAVGQGLVLDIDRRDRIFHIDDRGQRGFHQHIGNMGRIVLADRVCRVDHDLDMQPVMFEQQRRPIPTHQLRGFSQVRITAGVISPGTVRQGKCFIKKGLCRLDNMAAPLRIIAAGLCRWRVQRVGAVKGVVQTAPARIGGVQDKAVVKRRHHQLRSSHGRNFRINIFGRDGKRAWFFNQITDVLQKGLIFSLIDRLALVIDMPGVNLRLQLFPFGQQLRIAGRECAKQVGKTGPEFCAVDAGSRQGALIDKIKQLLSDLDAVLADIFGHNISSFQCMYPEPTGQAPRFQNFPGKNRCRLWRLFLAL